MSIGLESAWEELVGRKAVRRNLGIDSGDGGVGNSPYQNVGHFAYLLTSKISTVRNTMTATPKPSDR
jgi:hypothetical protein